jgi:transposase
MVAADETVLAVRTKFEALAPIMDERVRRHWAAGEAKAIGWGGIAAVAQATGLSRTTIQVGIAALQYPSALRDTADQRPRLRRLGGGRKPLTQTDRRLQQDLAALLESTTRGDPQSPLRWTCKSSRNLADELMRLGHEVSYQTVMRLLHEMGYSLQANRKTSEGAAHPDRNAQFKYITQKVQACQKHGQPVVSVDAKKRELVGDFKQGGREWRPQGNPQKVRTHDCEDKQLGHAIPYGVYDLTQNEGWVSVGIDHDTAEFAVETLRHWWYEMGCAVYPRAREMLVTADAGGSNSSRSRLWKVALQELADESGVRIAVCHFPPGTSKWNKIEHRMFCHITQNWRSQPLVSRAVVVTLIGNTRTRTGLQIRAKVDLHSYATGIKVTDEELAAVRIKRDKFHGEWNYTILPRS